MARVSNQQDDATDTKVALLSGDAPLERLDVGEVCLRFDERVGTSCADDRISASTITLDRYRDFGSPTNAGSQTRSKSLQKSQMTLVPNWLAIGVQRNIQLQPKDSR